jgi:hypothetical protein
MTLGLGGEGGVIMTVREEWGGRMAMTVRFKRNVEVNARRHRRDARTNLDRI